MAAVLEVTDGTTPVDLISLSVGIRLNDWTPQIAQPKGGGVVQSSTLAEGTRLRLAILDDVIESFNFKVDGLTQNQLILQMANLLQLLEKARQYWTTDWQNTIVYIKAQADCETNPRYAAIKNYSIPQLSNPYNQPFLQSGGRAIFDAIDLIVTRGQWLSDIPNQGTDTLISVVETYDGRNLGNVDSTGTREETADNEVFATFKHTHSNLTHIFTFDNSLTSFSSNLMDASLPFDLFPNPAGNGDIVYFGTQSSVTDSAPLSPLIFDITTAAAGTHTIVWEYWNGAAWVALVQLNDNTDNGSGPFRQLGVNSVTWIAAVAATTAINGVTAWWVRARISAFTSMTTVPQQGNRDVYTPSWPYLEVQDTRILGDIEALLNLTVFGQNDATAVSRLIISTRAVSRGSDFTAYLNASDSHNPANVTTVVGADSAFVSNSLSPTGRAVRFTPAAVIPMNDRLIIQLDSAIADQFMGVFRCFIRFNRSGLGTTFTARVTFTIGQGTTSFTSRTVTLPNANGKAVLDLGLLQIPVINAAIDIDIKVQMEASAAANTVEIWDVILMPADELISDFRAKSDATASIKVKSDTRLEIDGVRDPSRALLFDETNSEYNEIYFFIANQLITLPPKSHYRIWFALFEFFSTSDIFNHETTISTQVERSSRYLGMRGND